MCGRTFQSHYGLILSVRNSWVVFGRVFLSIPLWSDFIELRDDVVEISTYTFNPTMVWFYRTTSSAYLTSSTGIFQSHYGLILSSHSTNSRKRANQHFQSHYGLILSCCFPCVAVFAIHPFNPTMVWFYPQQQRFTCLTGQTFQSHYGLILS